MGLNPLSIIGGILGLGGLVEGHNAQKSANKQIDASSD